jgi:hypothetical protein
VFIGEALHAAWGESDSLDASSDTIVNTNSLIRMMAPKPMTDVTAPAASVTKDHTLEGS